MAHLLVARAMHTHGTLDCSLSGCNTYVRCYVLCRAAMCSSFTPQAFLQHVAQPLQDANGRGKENLMAETNTGMTTKPSPHTPQHAVKPIRMVHPGPVADDLPSMAELLAWKNPPASFCAMAFGIGTCLLASWAFTRQTPFLSGARSLAVYHRTGGCLGAAAVAVERCQQRRCSEVFCRAKACCDLPHVQLCTHTEWHMQGLQRFLRACWR